MLGDGILAGNLAREGAGCLAKIDLHLTALAGEKWELRIFDQTLMW
jgi:hypothetical protein